MSEKKVRRIAKEAGYRVEKGFQHYISLKGCPVITNVYGERLTGYNVYDDQGCLVWDCYDANTDHRWTLEDVTDFITRIYTDNGLTF